MVRGKTRGKRTWLVAFTHEKQSTATLLIDTLDQPLPNVSWDYTLRCLPLNWNRVARIFPTSEHAITAHRRGIPAAALLQQFKVADN